jgi:hypothetical protein
MRTPLFIAAIAGFFLSSCSSGNKMQSSSSAGDDLYASKTESYVQPEYVPQQSNEYNSSEKYESSEKYQQSNPDYTTTDQYTDENGDTYITNNYYGSDGGYTSSLNRWYAPSIGFSYYSPYYMGFNYYDPFYYQPGFSMSFSFGWGVPFYPYYSYYNPYYSYYPWYGYPYYPYYGNGYCNGYGGYYDGYCGGYNNYYYSNSYYGYNGSGTSSNTSGDGNGGRTLKMGNDFPETGDAGSQIGTVHGIPMEGEISTGKGIGTNPDMNNVNQDDNVGGKAPGSVQTQKGGSKSTPDVKSNLPKNISTPPKSMDNRQQSTPSRNNNAPHQNNQNKPPRTMALIPMNHQEIVISDKQEQAQPVKLFPQGSSRDEKPRNSSVKVYANHDNDRGDSQPQNRQYNNDNRASMNTGNYSRDNSNNSRPSGNSGNSERGSRR